MTHPIGGNQNFKVENKTGQVGLLKASDVKIAGNAFIGGKINQITLPDVATTLVGTDNSQTLTNKTFNDLTSFNSGLSVKNPDPYISGNMRFYDDDNSNFIDLHIQNHTLTSDLNLYLPNDTTNSVLVGTINTQTLTNKTFNDLTSFNNGLSVKNPESNTSGTMRFYDDDNSNFIDLHIQNHTLTSDLNLYLPNDTTNSVLVGTINTQTLTNKTFNDLNIDLGTNNKYSNLSYDDCKPLLLFNKSSSGTTHTHLVMKHDSSQSDYIVLRQNESGTFKINFENSGDRFEVSKNWDYGNAHAKFNYTGSHTHFYDPSAQHGGSASVAGSCFSFPDNGAAIYFNTTSTEDIGNTGAGTTNYFSFANSGDQQARITMDGKARIALQWLDNDDPSDRRIKYDIKDYGNATAVIDKIKIKSFMKYQLKNFNNDNEGNMLPFADRLGEAKYSIGVIAQEIADIPELAFMVEGSPEDTINPIYIHNYIPIISLLVKSNQEQQELINEMKLTLDKLNNSSTFEAFKA